MFFRGRKAAQPDKDWATEAADLIERTIDNVRDKAVVPLTTVARGIVYGTLGAILAISAVVLVAIMTVRLLDTYLDNIDWMPEGVWVADLIAGGIFVIGGLVLWNKRSAKNADSER